MESESGMVRARGRKVQTENHFRAAEPNRDLRRLKMCNFADHRPSYTVSSDGYSPVTGNAYDSMLY